MTSLDEKEQDFALSYLSPVAETLAQTSIGISDGDSLLAFDRTSGINKSASKVLIYFSGRWYDAISSADETDTYKLEPGAGYIYRRTLNSAGTSVWETIQNYNK
jgi:hypothetical protein